MNTCNECKGKGLLGGCPKCGEYYFETTDSTTEALEENNYTIPMYYRKNRWVTEKLKSGENKHCNAILTVLDRIVNQTSDGSKLMSSYAIFLPYGHGKKTAMFTIIQNYLTNGHTVAPVIDVASLAMIENNFRVNDKESMAQWKELKESDLVCVYGVDFSARYYTTKLYLNLCEIRALQGKPTLLFAENSLDDLRSKYIADNLSEQNNMKDIGCKLSHPYILDGVSRGRSGML